MTFRIPSHKLAVLAVMSAWSMLAIQSATTAPLNLRDVPIFLNENVAPLNMLVVGRDHKLYYEAYNDASDLDGDGYLDVGFKPSITYYGYFDSQTCYDYSSSRFQPAGGAGQPGNTCSNKWSGNWLNYMTTARIDALRKVLYGGRRIVDSATETVLERTHIPQDAHSWGKSYTSVTVDGYDIAQYAPLTAPNANRRHLFANTTLLNDSNQLPRFRVATNRSEPVWEWVSKERPVAGSDTISGTINPTDYVVRVQVCVAGSDFVAGDSSDDSGCRQYPDGNYKPTGLLHDYGEPDTMLFGLITGSYQKNTDGGVLRKAMGTFRDEVNAADGTFTNVAPGIIRTLNGLRTTGFGGNYEYTDGADNCGWITNGPISSGRCRMWGNPIGEMMYEALRYYAGKGSATAAFAISATGNPDASLGLSRATWDNPYGTGKPACAKPFMTVVSDAPSFDSDQVPGTTFGSFGNTLGTLNVSTLGQTIWNGETGGSAEHFIGQSGSLYDGSPTPKSVTSFGNIRGLAPEEPTKQGSWTSAAVAYYGNTKDLNSVAGTQRVQTFAVALASPLPRIEIPVAGRRITLVPFAKSVGGNGINADRLTGFQPTNQIVDFYIESMAPDMSSGVFRVNFEDVEQGADHDMDAIVRYAWQVNPGASPPSTETLTLTLTSAYAAGSIIQHMGYVIDGTTADGTYLEVRDLDTSAGGDVQYFLDTPPGQPPGGNWNDGQPLPLNATRTFAPGTTSGATVLKDPLWFAAKWGGFQDSNNNGLPDLQKEWDSDGADGAGNGIPDNYFLVTNALTLKSQLGKAFSSIIERSGSISAAAVNASVIREDTLVFNAEFTSSLWSGNLKAWRINQDGSIGDFEWSAANALPKPADRLIAAQNTDGTAVAFTWDALDTNRKSQLAPDGVAQTGQRRLDYLRGERSLEVRNGGPFRNRDPLSALGDFIFSAPLFVGASTARHSNSIESVAFSSYRTSTASRQPMVYIGGNDGMLHAFDAANGREAWAFIPRQAFAKLKPLTDVNYQHRYSVDGSPAVGDVFWGSSWKTVLVTSLGQGGQGLFAMDVTSPVATSQADVASKYLWEFTDAQDVDLGYTVSKPVITKLANGKWVAIFGNGYNNTVTDGRTSTTGNAVLYIVDIQNGSLLRKLSTNVGMGADPLNLSRPNGLASPAVVDIDRDSVADFAYAGDLFGNLWKFDLRGTDPADWKIAYQDASSNPLPFYVARDASNKHQPITSRPQVGRGAYGDGLMVYFGTGKFLEPADRVIENLSTQTFYGLKDNNALASTDLISGRAQLTQQTIDVETTVTLDGKASGIRVTSNNAIGTNRGWYLDLISPGNVFRGEMQVTDSVLRDERIVFTTLLPNADPCGYGGDSYIMILDALSGGQLANTFDLNGDGEFSNDDKYDDGTTRQTASGLQFENGIATRPTIVTNGIIDVLMMQGSGEGDEDPEDEEDDGCRPGAPCTQNIQAPPGFYGRQSWRQLR
ncbi:MAG: PQQ-binding-like beta-propeller repeat protein [Gammaproteobacteria bacterium]|nr:PQQ-binding-like beta-propeller repeat protein [Gammaproteobacteria bacterium]